MGLKRTARVRAAPALLRIASPPIEARHVMWSAIASQDDLIPGPTADLIDTALRSAEAARTVELNAISNRLGPLESVLMTTWPGEHYRLLAGVVKLLAPALVVEIGTYTGLGALALAAGSPTTRVVTYDVMDFRGNPSNALRDEDLNRIECRRADLSDPTVFEREMSVLVDAGVVFVDGPHDGKFEAGFTELLLRHLDRADLPLLIFDDIRMPSMLEFWRWLPVPKLDMTSFGHWSGTGFAAAPG